MAALQERTVNQVRGNLRKQIRRTRQHLNSILNWYSSHLTSTINPFTGGQARTMGNVIAYLDRALTLRVDQLKPGL
jgi:hypothetical protein